MARGGRYRTTRVALWSDRTFRSLTPHARLLYLCLATGSSSSLPGIGRYHVEALGQETGLTPAEIENAFLELEKTPTEAKAMVVRDRQEAIAWVRTRLEDDPAREFDPHSKSPSHRKAIEYRLGELPKDSQAVRRFRSYYRIFSTSTPPGPPPSPPTTPPPTPHQRGPTRGSSLLRIPDSDSGYRIPDSDSFDARAREADDPPRPAASDPALRPRGSLSLPSDPNGLDPPADPALHEPSRAQCDHRRAQLRAWLTLAGLHRTAADTEAGRVLAAEVAHFRIHGAWPDPPPLTEPGATP